MKVQLAENHFKRLMLATAAYLLVLLMVPEMVLRSPAAVDLLGTGSIRSGNLQLDVKAVDIENYQRRSGPVDCLIMGASNAQSNIIPADIQPDRFNCYNFALGAIQSYEASRVLDILLAKYPVKLLILGTTPSFFLPEPQPELVISGSRWVCCYNGRFDLAGFLSHHLVSYQYYELGLTRLLDPVHYGVRQQYAESLQRGFLARYDTYAPNQVIADDMHTYLVEYTRRIVADARSGTYPNAAFMQRLIEWQARGITVVIVEMPIRPELVQSAPEAEHAQRLFQTEVVPQLQSDGIRYLDPAAELDFADSQWNDEMHFNLQGAAQLSAWLNTQLAGAAQ